VSVFGDGGGRRDAVQFSVELFDRSRPGPWPTFGIRLTRKPVLFAATRHVRVPLYVGLTAMETLISGIQDSAYIDDPCTVREHTYSLPARFGSTAGLDLPKKEQKGPIRTAECKRRSTPGNMEIHLILSAAAAAGPPRHRCDPHNFACSHGWWSRPGVCR